LTKVQNRITVKVRNLSTQQISIHQTHTIQAIQQSLQFDRVISEDVMK